MCGASGGRVSKRPMSSGCCGLMGRSGARAARKSKQPLEPEALRAIAETPLRPTKPQQPLDIGLFEVRPPDAPHIVMPDE